jgi:putative solute:sodium symporter small subunit
MDPDRQSLNDLAYWRANLRLVAVCLAIWFTVSFGCGILLADVLNRFEFFGFKLGFWFAQQGSIYVFLLLIFFYAWRMNALDRRFGTARKDGDENGGT